MNLEDRVTLPERQNRWLKVALIGLAGILIVVVFAVDYDDPLKCPFDERDVRDALLDIDRGCTAVECYLYDSGIDLEYFGLHSMREDLKQPSP